MASATADAEPVHGPFYNLRGWLSWLLIGGFALAVIAGALGVGGQGQHLSPLAGAAKLALAFGVTIGATLLTALAGLWLVDTVLVFLKS